jgi:hypothetical protein
MRHMRWLWGADTFVELWRDAVRQWLNCRCRPWRRFPFYRFPRDDPAHIHAAAGDGNSPFANTTAANQYAPSHPPADYPHEYPHSADSDSDGDYSRHSHRVRRTSLGHCGQTMDGIQSKRNHALPGVS